MNTLQFVASLIDSLAWPLAVVLTVFALRRQLRAWLQHRPSRFKAGPLEVEWDSVVAQVETHADQPGLPDPVRIPQFRRNPDADLTVLARSNPIGAILEASARIEDDVRSRLQTASVRVQSEGLAGLARLAREHRIINSATEQTIAGLATLRNLAVHQRTAVGEEEAIDFVVLAEAARHAISASRLQESVQLGSDNVIAADVRELAESGRLADVVTWAKQSESSVKQRQVAVALSELRWFDEVVQIGDVISNRSELRTVCNALVKEIANGAGDRAWDALNHLHRRLRPPQLRDVLEAMAERGVQPRPPWHDTST